MKQKNKISMLFARIVLAGLASLLVVACSNSFLEKSSLLGANRTGTGSTGTLTIKVADNSRTILPKVSAENISSYNILLKRSGYTDVSFTGLTSLTAPIPDLAIGTWTITVSGFDSDAKKITEGTTVFNVTAGSCTASVALKSICIRTAGGTGTLDVKFSYEKPEGNSVWSSVALTTYPDLVPITIPDGGVVISQTFETITINTPLPSGTYMLTINLERDFQTHKESYPSITNIVQIYDNQISSAVIVLTADDLTQAPKSPTNFRFTAFDGTNITLEWNDNSDVEESFT